ncbi:MAG: dephospho-CoA kinase [Chloroflexota bacterium]
MNDNRRSRWWPAKVIVGLTGNIATGKSVILRLAAAKGALTLDADKIVHEIMDSDADLQAAIAATFGSHVRRPDGRIDRPALGQIVFSDPQALRQLEQMIHPAVRVELWRRVAASPARVVFVEAIKLLEGSLARECDQVWVTHCPPAMQIERLMSGRGMDEATAVQRVQVQSPQAEKLAQADVAIDTSGSLAETEAQFTAAWRSVMGNS